MPTDQDYAIMAGMTLMRRGLAIAVLVVALIAGGCGGGSKTTTPQEWANSLCSSLNTWKDSVVKAANSLSGGNVTRDSLKRAADDVKDATHTLTDDLKGLGKPNTQAGQEAKDTVDQLSTQLKDGADKIESAANDVSDGSGVLQAMSVVAGAFTTMGNQIRAAYNKVRSLKGGQELTNALTNSDSCKTLTSSGNT
jgi:uncharacterized phage infection (PIP) family protein YhgE